MSKSTIGTYVIRGPKGPTGPTGPTGNPGETGNTGPTGPTGDYGRYIKNIEASQNSIILTLSDGNTFQVLGNFRGATNEFYISGTTTPSDALSLISSFNTGTQTVSIRGLTFTGSLYLTEDSNYIYVHSNVSPTASQVDIANLNQNTLVYLKTNTQISSTSIGISYDANYYHGTLVYDDNAYSNGKSKLNASSKINYISPVFKGDDPIYLNADDAGTFYIATPIGIAGITGTFRKNESIAITLITENENIWHFPENIYFESNENYLTCGKSVINLTSTDQGETWLATVAARGFDVDVGNCTISNTLGSCCYTSSNFEEKCLDYTTKEICDSYFGTFNALKSCQVACGATGICCTNGKCIENSNPAECASFGGSFYSGITCAAFDNDPNGPNFGNRLCPNNCEQDGLVSCCKDGICLGDNFTKLLCEQVLGGKAVEGGCGTANCCDQLVGNGPCCTLGGGCIQSTKVECDALGGIYMGEGFECSQINCECLDNNQTEDPFGACCVGDTCSQEFKSICESDNGIFIGGLCTDTTCQTPSGACCKDCGCSVTSEAVCNSQNGTYQGDGTNCTNNPCNTGEECSCTDDSFQSSYDCVFDNQVTCDVSVKMFNKENTELTENTSHFTSGIAFPQVRSVNGTDNTIFRQGMAVKDFYLPVESMISSTGEPTIKINSEGTGRVCLKLNVAGISQMNSDEIKSLRFYVLRTFYPRHFSHNLAALRGLSFEEQTKYAFIDPTLNTTEENTDLDGNIISSVDGEYYFYGTKKLREQLNGPLYGQIRKNAYDSGGTNQPTFLSLNIRPKAYESNYKSHFLNLGLNTFGMTGIYDIVNISNTINSADSRIFSYNSNFNTYGLAPYSGNITPRIGSSNNTTKLLAIPSNQNNTIFFILDSQYYDNPNNTNVDSEMNDFNSLSLQFETIKYEYPYGTVNLANINSINTDGVVIQKNFGSLPFGPTPSTLGYTPYLYLLAGYHSHGYKTFSDNILPKDTIRSYYKTLSKLSLGFSNRFVNLNEKAKDEVFGKLGFIISGHPWTVDLRYPDYRYEDPLFGSPKLVSKKYTTDSSSIIFDSSTIILSKNYLPHNGRKAYHKIVKNIINDYDGDIINNGVYIPSGNGDLNVAGFKYLTRLDHNQYFFNADAIADPYFETKRTAPRGSMSISDELNADGSINISVCLTIPNIRSYMASFDDITGDNDHNNSDYENDGISINDGYRFKAFADSLRIVFFTDIISPNYTVDQKDIGTTTTITLNTACEGEGCNFETYDPASNVCQLCAGDFNEGQCKSYYFAICTKFCNLDAPAPSCPSDGAGIDCIPDCPNEGGDACCGKNGTQNACGNYWFQHSGKITFSSNNGCKIAKILTPSKCVILPGDPDNCLCGSVGENDRFCATPAYTQGDVIGLRACTNATDCDTTGYVWPACGNPEPAAWRYLGPGIDDYITIYLPDDFDLNTIESGGCGFISSLLSGINGNCPCEGASCYAPFNEQSSNFRSFTSKKIYLNATDSICVPIENSDVRSLNNFEDCDS